MSVAVGADSKRRTVRGNRWYKELRRGRPMSQRTRVGERTTQHTMLRCI